MNCAVSKCEDVIRHGQAITDLVGWQKSQNGAIHDVNEKVDALKNLLMGLLATSVLSLLGTVFLLLRTGGHA